MKYYITILLCFLLCHRSSGQDSLCHPRLVETAVKYMIVELKEEDDFNSIAGFPLDSALQSYHFNTRNNYYLNRDSVRNYIYAAYRRGGWLDNWFGPDDAEAPLQIYAYFKIHGIDTCFETILKPFIAKKNQEKQSDSIDYAYRKNADTINGIYIPKNINECAAILEVMLPDTVKNKITKMSIREFSASAHSGLGRWIRNNWGLWAGSRLRNYFTAYSVNHPEGMSGIILDYFYWHLIKEPTTLRRLIDLQNKQNKKYKTDAEKRKNDIFNRYKTGDTVAFKFRDEFITPAQKKNHEDDDCEALGIVLKKDKKKEKLLIRLISSCDPSCGIITQEYYIAKKGTQYITWKGLMKEGEQRWLNYRDWEAL